MPLTSARERRLWLGAAVTLVAIYLSLAFVRAPTEWLRERNLLRVTVATIFLLVLVWLVRRVLRERPSRGEIVFLSMFLLLYIVVLARMERAEERIHFIEYGLVGALVYSALLERRDNLAAAGRPSRGPARWPELSAVVITAMAGWLDEGIQAILPSRVYELRDVALNVAAGALVVGAMSGRRWVRRRRSTAS